MTRRREQGYAMIAAVTAVAVFGYMAIAAIAGGRSAVVAASAGQARARMIADADAGVALAIHGLGLISPAERWSLTGPARVVDFEGARLTIAVEDENGKIPINFVSRDEIRRLFEQGGADPRQIDGLVEALIVLRGDIRPADAPRPDPRLAAQRGPLTSTDELMLLPGMTPALFARIAPAVTVHTSNLTFDPRTASSLALGVMAPTLRNGPTAIGLARAQAGERPALDSETINLAGHTVNVRVDVADGSGGQLRRTTTVQFTGVAVRPYVVRGLD